MMRHTSVRHYDARFATAFGQAKIQWTGIAGSLVETVHDEIMSLSIPIESDGDWTWIKVTSE